jgi:8-oxo-dGTP pyrophosphatase MutT (NUDIX family)
MVYPKPTDLKPWRKGASDTLAKGYGKELRKTQFTNPTTNEVQDFILFGQRDWSVVLAITSDGMVIAERQYKQGCDKIYIDLPAGTTDFKGELPQAVAKRELLEETGYKATEVIFLGPPLWMSSRNSWTRFWPFVALGCEKVQPAKIDANEEIETLLFSISEWLEFCQTELEDHSAYVATMRSLQSIQQYFPNINLSRMLGIG